MSSTPPSPPPSTDATEAQPPLSDFIRGHWRREFYGPGRTLQRTVWIEPAVKRVPKP